MPYGHDLAPPSSTKDRENTQEHKKKVVHHRWEALPEVKKELSSFAKKGYKYKESDLRWSHVLINRQDGKIFLCDLESLVHVDALKNSREKLEEAVWSQLEILLLPMVTTFNLANTLNWMKENKDKVPSLIARQAICELADADDFKALDNKDANNLTTKDKVLLHAIQYWKNEGEAKNEGGSPGSRSEPSLESDNKICKGEEADAQVGSNKRPRAS